MTLLMHHIECKFYHEIFNVQALYKDTIILLILILVSSFLFYPHRKLSLKDVKSLIQRTFVKKLCTSNYII